MVPNAAVSGYLLLVLVSILTCAGQLSQKQAVECWQHSPPHLRLSRTFTWLVLACLLLGFAMLCWLNVLQRFPLSIAYPFLSLNFILVTLAAYWLYGEKTTLRHWLGLLFIMLGILLLGIGQ